MKRWICMAGLFAISMLAQAQAPVAEVLAVRGEANVATGAKLQAGAEIKTGPGGRVRLRFADGSTLVLGDNTVLKIERFEQSKSLGRDALLRLDMGLIGQKIEPSPNGNWEVRTPTAVTAVRGTEFVVEVGADQATEVNVQSGKVVVEALQSAGGNTRSLKPRSIVNLEQAKAGTQCNPAQGCSAASTWSAERIKRTQDRLGGI